MQKKIGLLLLFLAIFGAAAFAFKKSGASYYIKSPYAKLMSRWSDDIRLLQRVDKLPKQWAEIKELEIGGDNSWPTQDWLEKITTSAKAEINSVLSIKKNPNGRYKLEVFLVHWIEGYRYGVVVQYHLVDLATTNTIWELDRTFKLGIVY